MGTASGGPRDLGGDGLAIVARARSCWGHAGRGRENIHGTRVEEDPRLLDYLTEKKIPLEMCPLSNVRTGVVGSIDEHPIRRYYQRELVVTVNTDDPKMFGNSLAEEYRLLETRLGFSREEIRGLILQGIQASWLSQDRKQQLCQEFCKDATWQLIEKR